MTDRTAVLLGRPIFGDAGAAMLAQAGHPESAWRAQLASAASLAGARGDFAIGLAPASTPGSALLASDRFAMRTICWRVDAQGLHFAERADKLAGPGAELDPQAIFDYLFFHAIPSPRTIWKGVHRLPPGHRLRFDDGRATVEPYWQPSFVDSRGAAFEPLAAEFRALLEQAVREQLDGTKPACFLSGGTDSSTIAGMAMRAAGNAATYSIGFDASGYDEMEFARIAARHFGTEHHEYYVTPVDLVESIPKVAASYDQPFGNSSALPAYYCARMARADGASRILAGDGGDELFGGNVRYAKQRVFRFYDGIPAGVRRTVIEPWALSGLARRLPGLRKLSSYVAQARLGLPARLETYNLLLRLGIENVLTPTFIESIDAEDPARQQAEVWRFARTPSELNRHLAFDWRYTLAETDLPKVRGTADLAGLAVGYPMLDQRLVDFSLGLPPDYKLRGIKLRWFFKEALRGFLPDETIVKKKQGFGLPFGVWAMKNAALKTLASDSLHSLAGRGIVNERFINELLAQHLPAHPGYYGEMVWILMMLEQWLLAHAPTYRLGGRTEGRVRHSSATVGAKS